MVKERGPGAGSDRNEHDVLRDEWEALLRDGLVTVPADFQQRVSSQIARDAQPEPLHPAARPGRWRPAVRRVVYWLGLFAGSVLGAMSMLQFVFGVWLAAAAA